MLSLLPFSMGIDFFGQATDIFCLLIFKFRKWESIKTAVFIINRAIFKSSSGSQSPQDVNPARHHTKPLAFIKRNGNQLVVWHNFRRQEGEESVLSCLDRRNVLVQPLM